MRSTLKHMNKSTEWNNMEKKRKNMAITIKELSRNTIKCDLRFIFKKMVLTFN